MAANGPADIRAPLPAQRPRRGRALQDEAEELLRLVLRKTEPLSSLAAPVITPIPFIPATQFSTGHASPHREEGPAAKGTRLAPRPRRRPVRSVLRGRGLGGGGPCGGDGHSCGALPPHRLSPEGLYLGLALNTCIYIAMTCRCTSTPPRGDGDGLDTAGAFHLPALGLS